jgi:hypothetical protein
LRDVEVPAGAANFNAYRRQQHRWKALSFECAVVIPRVWSAPIVSCRNWSHAAPDRLYRPPVII